MEFQHPSDGFYQIEPLGEHFNARADVEQVVDGLSARSIVSAFNIEADRPGFAGMLIDREHFKHDMAQETRAYGWLLRLENRSDGIYGKIRWTTTGRAAVDGGDYRYFSTEYELKHMQPVGPSIASPRKLRPMRLDGLTLTNVPNNRGGRPITNRWGHPDPYPITNRRWGATTSPYEMPSINQVLQVVSEGVLESVRNVQARTGKDFTIAWHHVMADHPELPRIMNRGIGLEALAALEPEVKARYASGYKQAAVACGEADPKVRHLDKETQHIVNLSRLSGLLNEIAAAHPKAGFDERWEIAKRNAPEHFWAFIAEDFAGIKPHHPKRHQVQYFYRKVQ